jgi:hypothetical protein
MSTKDDIVPTGNVEITPTSELSEEEKISNLQSEVSTPIVNEELPKKEKTSFVSEEEMRAKDEPQKGKQQNKNEPALENPAVTIMKIANSMLEISKINNKSLELAAKSYDKLAYETELLRKSIDNQTEFFKSLTHKTVNTVNMVNTSNTVSTPRPTVQPQQSTTVNQNGPKPSTKTLSSYENSKPSTSSTTTKPEETHQSTETPSSQEDKLRMMFPEEIESRLNFDLEKSTNFAIIKPKQFLGSENFAKVSAMIRQKGGEYISAGSDSHWRIPKKSLQ